MHRAAAFDRMIADTLEVLDKPSVVQAFDTSDFETGILSTIRSVVANAHLPNVRYNRAVEPAAYRDSDSLAIIPVTKWEKRYGIVMDPSMYQLSPRRLLDMGTVITARYPDDTLQMQDLRSQAITSVALDEIRTRPDAHRLTLRGSGHCHAMMSSTDRLSVAAKPILLIEAAPLREHGQTILASVVGHEALHGFDEESEAVICDPVEWSSDERRAQAEARAYHFSACVSKGMDEPVSYPGIGLTAEQVDEIRACHNPDPVLPFAAPAGLIAEYKQLGLI